MSVSRSQLSPRARRAERHLAAVPTGPTIAIPYGRMSDADKAEEGPSLPHQFAICDEYIARRDGWIIGERFDDGMSGRRDDRAGYQRMLATVRSLEMEGKRVAVVVRHLDRLGRNLDERVRAWKELKALGAEIHAVADGGHQQSEVTYNVLASIAQEEARLAGERITSKNDRFEADGWHRPARLAWGYALRPATADERAIGSPKAVLVEHEAEAPYVRELWRRAVEGQSMHAIAHWIAGLSDEARGGRALRDKAARFILRSPLYVGRFGPIHDLRRCVDDIGPHGRCPVLDQPTGRWPRYVEDDEWQATHDHYRRGVVMPRAGRPPVRLDGERFLLTGLLRCHKCGNRMRGNTSPAHVRRDGSSPKERSFRRRYQCATGTGAPGQPQACFATVSADAVERPVLETLGEMLDVLDDERLLAQLRRAWAAICRADASADQSARQIAHQQQALQKAAATLAALTQKFAGGEITQLAYTLAADDLQRKIEAGQAELDRLKGRSSRPELPPLDVVLRGVGGWAIAIDAGSVEVKRRALADLVEWVRPVPVARGKYSISLQLTPTGKVLQEAALGARPGLSLVSIGEKAGALYRIDTQRRRAS